MLGRQIENWLQQVGSYFFISFLFGFSPAKDMNKEEDFVYLVTQLEVLMFGWLYFYEK